MVTIEIRELDIDIKQGKIKKVYFFYGPEIFLIDNKINSIKKRILKPDNEEFCFSKFNGKDSNFEEFKDEFYSFPMLGGNKLIILQNTGWFLNSKSKEFVELKNLFNNIPEHLFLIIREDEFDKKRAKSIEYLYSINGAILNVLNLPNAQLCSWVDSLFSNAGKNIKQSDISYIVNACSCDMAKINSEVTKLIVFADNDDTIKTEDVRVLITKTVEYRIYELFDDIVESRGNTAFEKLKQIFESKEKPTSVIFGLTDRFSELLTLKLLYADRVTVSEMCNYTDYKTSEYIVKKMLSQSKKFGEKYLKRIIKMGLNFDLAVKTGKIDAKIAAEMFVSELIRMD